MRYGLLILSSILIAFAIFTLNTRHFTTPGNDNIDDKIHIVRYFRNGPTSHPAISGSLPIAGSVALHRPLSMDSSNHKSLERSLLDTLSIGSQFDRTNRNSFIECSKVKCDAKFVQRQDATNEEFKIFEQLMQSEQTKHSLLSSGYEIDSMAFGTDRETGKNYFEITLISPANIPH